MKIDKLLLIKGNKMMREVEKFKKKQILINFEINKTLKHPLLKALLFFFSLMFLCFINVALLFSFKMRDTVPKC